MALSIREAASRRKPDATTKFSLAIPPVSVVGCFVGYLNTITTSPL